MASAVGNSPAASSRYSPAGQWAKPQGIFNLKDVLAASLISFGVIAELRRSEAQLLSDEGA